MRLSCWRDNVEWQRMPGALQELASRDNMTTGAFDSRTCPATPGGNGMCAVRNMLCYALQQAGMKLP